MMMTKPRWKKVLADFWENKARAALVVASIFVGVYAIGMIMITREILPESLAHVYQSANPAHIILHTQEFDDELIQAVSRIDGVAVVTGRRTVGVRARLVGEDDWENLLLIAIEDPANAKMKQLTLQSGTLTAEKGEIIILTNALSDFPVEPGDVLEIELDDGALRTMPVAGIAKDYSAGLELTKNPRMAYVDADSLEFLHVSDSFDTLYIVTEGESVTMESIQAVAVEIEECVEDSGRVVVGETLQTPAEHPYDNYIDAIAAILSLMGVLVVILGSFLIINMMNSLMAQQVRQIGVMKLIGAQNRDIVGMYLALVSLFSMVAFLFSVPMASFSAYLLSDRVAELINGELVGVSHLPTTPTALILQAIVAFIVPAITSLTPIMRGAKITVQQALDNSLIKNEDKSSRFDDFMENIRGVYGIILLAMRNTFRRKGRLMMTLFTLSLGGAIFISVFNVRAVLDRHVDLITNICDADLFVSFDEAKRIDEIVPLVEAVSGVALGEAWQSVNAQLELDQQVENVYLEAAPDGSALLNGYTYTGRWVAEDEINTVVVNEDFVRSFPGLKPGDILTLKVDGDDVDLTVTGIFNYAGLQEKQGYINAATAANLLGTSKKSTNYRLVAEDLRLESLILLDNTVTDVFHEYGYDDVRVAVLEVTIDELSEKINIVITVLLILAILTGIVGSIGLSGTLSLNVLERTSEIGILRAIGAYDKIISRLVVYEGLFIGSVSYVIGVILSFPISIVLGNMVNQAIFGAPAQLAINMTGFILWFVLVIVMSIVASLLPARNATRLTIREVLAYE